MLIFIYLSFLPSLPPPCSESTSASLLLLLAHSAFRPSAKYSSWSSSSHPDLLSSSSLPSQDRSLPLGTSKRQHGDARLGTWRSSSLRYPAAVFSSLDWIHLFRSRFELRYARFEWRKQSWGVGGGGGEQRKVRVDVRNFRSRLDASRRSVEEAFDVNGGSSIASTSQDSRIEPSRTRAYSLSTPKPFERLQQRFGSRSRSYWSVFDPAVSIIYDFWLSYISSY